MLQCLNTILEVPWTWERGSRGQKPKSLQKRISGAWVGPKSPKKVRKIKKKSEKEWVFDFSDLFRDFSDWRFSRDFFESFWLLASRLPLPGPRPQHNSLKMSFLLGDLGVPNPFNITRWFSGIYFVAALILFVERKQKAGFLKGRLWRMCPHSNFGGPLFLFLYLVPVLGVKDILLDFWGAFF